MLLKYLTNVDFSMPACHTAKRKPNTYPEIYVTQRRRNTNTYLVHPRQHICDIPPRVVRMDLDRPRQSARPASRERHDEPLEQRSVPRGCNLRVQIRYLVRSNKTRIRG